MLIFYLMGRRVVSSSRDKEGTMEPVRLAPKRSRGRPSVTETELIESELLDGALRMFLANGYGGTSLSEIVKALGISKTTLYSRYPSKAHLFRAIINRQVERLSALSALEVDGERLSLPMGLRAYANRSLEISLQGDVLEVNQLIQSEARRFPELGEAAAERMRSGVRHVAIFVERCAERDRVPCRDPQGVAEVFIAMLRGWYDGVMLAGRPISAAMRETWVERAVHVLVSARHDW